MQSDQETGTSTTTLVTPGRQHYHPGADKGNISFNGTGTIATRFSYNVTGLTDGGTGTFSIDWITDFSSTDYGFTFGGRSATSSDAVVWGQNTNAPAAGTLYLYAGTGSTGALADFNYVCVRAFGDQ